MALFIPPLHQPSDPDVPAMVRVLTRGELEWNRPVFKAPPLVVKIPVTDNETFFAQTRKFERSGR